MIAYFKHVLWPSRVREEAIEREKVARLEKAERDVDDLKARGSAAVQFLTARDDRNHWGESIREMIQGVL